MVPGSSTNFLSWMVGDHLGSTTMVTDVNGWNGTPQRYKAWGKVRPGPGNGLPTDYTFTGQQTVESIGLMFYNARWYDASLGRFIQADSIIPGGGQGLDRYAYVNNSPTNFTDPSGHNCEDLPEGSRDQCIHTRSNEPKRVIEMPIPGGVNEYGTPSFNNINKLIEYARDLGIELTPEDLLALLICQEYFGPIGNVKAWHQAIAKRFHTYCKNGAFSSECLNKFWGYIQMYLHYDQLLEAFNTFILNPTEDAKADFATAKEIAHAILHPLKPNKYGIDASECGVNDRCDWVLITPINEAFYNYILTLDKPWIYSTQDGFDILMTDAQVRFFCEAGGNRCNLTNKTTWHGGWTPKSY